MRILEVHIEVRDLHRSLRFYERLLPHKRIIRWKDGSAVALVLDDGSSFGIWRKGKEGLFKGRGGEHLHFAFEISLDELESCRKRLQALDVEVHEHDWPNGHKSLYFFDPDGHQGEFMTCDWLAL